MPQKKKENKQKNKKLNGKKIVTVDCNVRKGGKALIIEYTGITYITSQALLSKLLHGTLKTQKGKLSKSVQLGILEENGDDKEILSDTGVFLTKKGNALYFAPNDDELLVGSTDGFMKLLSGEWEYLKLGKFI